MKIHSRPRRNCKLIQNEFKVLQSVDVVSISGGGGLPTVDVGAKPCSGRGLGVCIACVRASGCVSVSRWRGCRVCPLSRRCAGRADRVEGASSGSGNGCVLEWSSGCVSACVRAQSAGVASW